MWIGVSLKKNELKIYFKLLRFHFHRLIEEFQLEGTLKSHLVHPPAMGSDIFN